MLMLGWAAELAPGLCVFLLADVGENNALQRFLMRFVAIYGRQDHPARLQDIPPSVFANGEQLVPSVIRLAKSRSQLLISKRVSCNFL